MRYTNVHVCMCTYLKKHPLGNHIRNICITSKIAANPTALEASMIRSQIWAIYSTSTSSSPNCVQHLTYHLTLKAQPKSELSWQCSGLRERQIGNLYHSPIRLSLSHAFLYHFPIALCLSPAAGDSLKGADDQSIGSSLPHALAQWNITLRYIFRVQHSVPGRPYRLRPEKLESSRVMLSGSMSNVFFKIQTLLLSGVLHPPLLHTGLQNAMVWMRPCLFRCDPDAQN